jgi:hypothetical protein
MENIADAFSSIITGEHVMGEDLCDCDDSPFTRDLDTPDIQWPSFVQDKYLGGRSMSGAYWDMKTSFSDDEYSLSVLLHSIKKQPQYLGPLIAFHAVLVDDDSDINPNGDDVIGNGSPNYEKINASFRLHGLATSNVEYVDIDWSGGAPGDPQEDATIDVAVTVDPGNLTLVGTDPVKLRYRFNQGDGAGGSWTTTAMTYRSQEDDYHAEIDTTGYAVGTVIDFYVRVEVTDASKRYTSFPLQAQFDFDDANAEERDFFSVIITNSAKDTVLSTDLQTDPSWTVSDGWEFGSTPQAEFGETPGYDYPYDSDDAGGTPAPYCYFTGDTQGGDPYRLTTTSFDLDASMDAAVVSYAAWVYIRNGTEDVDYLQVEIGDGSNWVEVDLVTPAGSPANALQRWIRRRVNVPSGQLNVGRKLRFSTIRSSGFIEAAVDEVRVWGVYE